MSTDSVGRLCNRGLNRVLPLRSLSISGVATMVTDIIVLYCIYIAHLLFTENKRCAPEGVLDFMTYALQGLSQMRT